MAAVVLFSVLLMGVLLVLLARYGAPLRRRNGDPRPPMSQGTLRRLTVELLAAMGMDLEKPLGDDSTLMAVRRDPLGDTRLVVVLAPNADQTTILAAAETVHGEGATRGMLISPGEIERAGLAQMPLEVIDGPAFRRLIADHLPQELEVVDRHRGFGPPPRSLVPRPV